MPTVSRDGRFVSFKSNATNLVANDTNGTSDVFVRDVKRGTTTRVNLSTAGAEANSGVYSVLISADGRFVLWDTPATNLVAGDTNGNIDVFLRNRDVNNDGIFDQAGDVSTIRVSVDSSGAQANGDSNIGGISRDGRFVSFTSYSTNLVSGDTNGFADAFVRDNWTGVVTRVSLDSSGAQANNYVLAGPMSGDGRFVLMSGTATNMYPGDVIADIQAFLRDRDPDKNGILDEPGNVSTTLASVLPNGNPIQFGRAAREW